MRLFYEHGKPQVAMSLEEFAESIKMASEATPIIKATAMPNGSRTGSTRVGRKRVVRVAHRRRVVAKRPVTRTVKAKRRAPRDEAAITRKRMATMARNRAAKLETEQASEPPMAVSQ